MTDTADKSIDEILRYFRGWVSLAGNSGEPMYKLGEYEQGELDEAKQAIKDLIATEVLHARIEELSNLKAEKGRFSTSSYGLWVDGAIDNRIVELEAQLNKGVVQNEHPLEEE